MSGEMDGVGSAVVYANLFLGLARWAADEVEGLRVRLREEARVRRELGEWERLEDMIVAGGYAESTAVKYAACARRFLEWLGVRPYAATPTDVEDFLDHRRALGKGRADRRLHLASLRAVFDRLLQLEVTRGVQYPPKPEPVTPAREADVEKLCEVVSEVREAILISLLYVEKLRPAQIAWALWGGLSPDGRTLTVQWDTLGRRRTVKVGSKTRELLLKDRRSNPRAALFQSGARTEQPMTVSGIEALFRRLCAKAGVQVTCTAVRMRPDPATK